VKLRHRLGVAASVAALALSGLELTRADDRPSYDWGVAYYMSYDNNLESCGQPIIKMIREGVTSERVVAAVQADFTDPGGMHRYTIKSTGMDETRVRSDDSASEDEAIAYLQWFVKTFRCKHYVFTFLDHGGQIDEMCFDEHPGPGGKHWMSGRALGARMRELAKSMGDTWELLFLQQCGRGSLENLYSFRRTAKFIMSSPVPVGAPNTYYAELGRWLSAHPDAAGADVAKEIAARDEHYTTYTCLRTAKLDELPRRLDAVLAPLLAAPGLVAPPAQRVIHPADEPIVDSKAFFEAIASVNSGAGAPAVASFFEWTRGELFTQISFHRGSERLAKRLCGLSIFAPSTPAEAVKYAALDLYKESQLPALWKRIATGPKPDPD
jgi:hypothetical protein